MKTKPKEVIGKCFLCKDYIKEWQGILNVNNECESFIASMHVKCFLKEKGKRRVKK